MPTTLPAQPKELPALKLREGPPDFRPVVVIDTREKTPLEFARLASERGTLNTGDYSFRGAEDRFAIERKTVADLVACCVGQNRERYFRELARLRGYDFKRLLIIGSPQEIAAGDYRSEVAPNAVLGTLSTIEARFDVPVVFTPGAAAASVQVERWIYYAARETMKAASTLAATAAAAPGEAA